MVVIIATTIPITSGTEMPRYIKPVASLNSECQSHFIIIARNEEAFHYRRPPNQSS
jgi:hypothetical protein